MPSLDRSKIVAVHPLVEADCLGRSPLPCSLFDRIFRRDRTRSPVIVEGEGKLAIQRCPMQSLDIGFDFFTGWRSRGISFQDMGVSYVRYLNQFDYERIQVQLPAFWMPLSKSEAYKLYSHDDIYPPDLKQRYIGKTLLKRLSKIKGSLRVDEPEPPLKWLVLEPFEGHPGIEPQAMVLDNR